MGKTKKVVLLIIGVIIIVLVVLGAQNRNRDAVSPAPISSWTGISTTVAEEISTLNVPSDWLTYTYTDTKYDWQIRYPKDLKIIDRKNGYIAFVLGDQKASQVLIHAGDGYLENKSVDQELQVYDKGMRMADPLLKNVEPKIVLLNGVKGVKYKFSYPCEPECGRTDITLFNSEASGGVSSFYISLNNGNKEQGEVNKLMLSTFTVGKK